jgi:hypothetical protein
MKAQNYVECFPLEPNDDSNLIDLKLCNHVSIPF